MNKKLAFAGTLAGVMLVTLGIAASTVGAQNQNAAPATPQSQESQGGPMKDLFRKQLDPAKLEEMKAKHEAIDAAIEAGNYDEWKKLMEEMVPENAGGKTNPLLEKITKDNFARFAEMHKLQEEAKDKLDQAATIAKELGLPERPGMGGPHMMMKGDFGPGKGFRHGPGFGPAQGDQQPPAADQAQPQ